MFSKTFNNGALKCLMAMVKKKWGNVFLDLDRATDFEIARPATSRAATSVDALAATDFESDRQGKSMLPLRQPHQSMDKESNTPKLITPDRLHQR